VERWQQIESLFQEALQRDPAERDAYVREACNGDSGLQCEVSSLLANHHEAIDFEPWAAVAAAQLIAGRASLEAGQRLGPYEILAPIGAGGMGEVYKARDTRLKRDVAIKICAAQFSERFEREARVIASLNHPNICQLYDVGPNFLVMELVEGENLSVPLPVETALHYARQIAEALEAAHEKGIVHRDLKPTNVKITPAGVVKVLDFGLAKAAEAPVVSRDPSDSPTQTISVTRAGMILGTAAYMSPEQARGAAVDKRADIWAFGCVLYEMLSGKQAFHGETTSDILAAVLKEEPDWSRIPAKVQPLLRRCLVKDPKHRLRDIGDAMPLLEGAPESPAASRPSAWVLATAILGIAFVVTGVGWWRSNRPAPPRPLARLSVELSPAAAIDRIRSGNQLALSPDGTRIAVMEYYAEGQRRLVARRLDQSQFTPLFGPEGSANMPFFSPDGEWIAFFADGKLKKVPVQGGAPVTLCDAPGLVHRGASWGDDGNIIAALGTEPGLSRIPSGGGSPTRVREANQAQGQIKYGYPQVLPGSQAVLFTALSSGATYDDAHIDVLSFRTGERKTIFSGGFFGRYLASGHLIYMHQNMLYAAPFDLGRLMVTGSPQPVVEDVSNNIDLGSANFDFSQTGTFVYAGLKGLPHRSIFWLDRAGQTQPLYSALGFYPHSPGRFSPDGKQLAFGMDDDRRSPEIWVKNLERDTTSRLTSLGRCSSPVWTPDGRCIVFASYRQEAMGIFWIRADGVGEAHRLTEGKRLQGPRSFSPDGKWLAFEESGFDGRWSIWIVPAEVDRDPRPPGVRLGKAEPFQGSGFSERSPVFSPDGRWLAYQSNETGTWEVYVRPFPGPGGKFPISTGGGRFPIWSRGSGAASRELFFLSPDWHIKVANFTANGDSFSTGKPQLWSQSTLLFLGNNYPYELAPDGKRFAAVLYPGGTSERSQNPIDSVSFVLNFFDELKRRVPTRGN
jgi:serine/threonine-protein kinase